jgi:uncharacterized ParB-like nuclease family protein
MSEGDQPSPVSNRADADKVNAVLEGLRLSAQTRSLAQQIAADRTGSLNRRLGSIATVLAAIGGTSAFVSLSQSTNSLWVGAAAAFSILAAVVSGLQTYFNYGAVSGEHRKWAAQFGELARRIAFAQATPVGGELTQKRFDRFNGDLAQFDKDSLNVPDRDYQRARRQIMQGTDTG